MAFNESILQAAFNLPPEKAVLFFGAKVSRETFNWFDVLEDSHERAFTVAKTANADVLEDIRLAVDDAIRNGVPLAKFKKNLIPILQKKGWWGKKEIRTPDGKLKEVQLGTPWRLKTILNTNVQSAYMKGRAERHESLKESRPFLEYVAVLDQNSRPHHAAMDGKVFPVDDPFWKTHYPVNGFNCRCRVRSLSRFSAKRKGVEISSSEGNLTTEKRLLSKESGVTRNVTVYTDPKTGKKMFPDVGFNQSPLKPFKPDRPTMGKSIKRQLDRDVRRAPVVAKAKTKEAKEKKISRSYDSIINRKLIETKQILDREEPLHILSGDNFIKVGLKGNEFPVPTFNKFDKKSVEKIIGKGKLGSQYKEFLKVKDSLSQRTMFSMGLRFSRHFGDIEGAGKNLFGMNLKNTTLPNDLKFSKIIDTSRLRLTSAELEKVRSTARKAEEFFEKNLAESMLPKVKLNGVELLIDERSFYRIRSEKVFVDLSRGENSLIHEVGHHIHETNERIKDFIEVFYRRRAEGEVLTSINLSVEDGIKDKLFSHYAGKWYGRGKTIKIDGKRFRVPDFDDAKFSGESIGTEILSKGLERIRQSPMGMLAEDPEYFILIRSILDGDIPK